MNCISLLNGTAAGVFFQLPLPGMQLEWLWNNPRFDHFQSRLKAFFHSILGFDGAKSRNYPHQSRRLTKQRVEIQPTKQGNGICVMLHHLSDHPKRLSKHLNILLLNTISMDSTKPGFRQHMVVEFGIGTLGKISPHTLTGHRHIALHVQVKGLRKGPVLGHSGDFINCGGFILAQPNMGMGPVRWWGWWRDEHSTTILVRNSGYQEWS